jgi:hypothetical protein
MSSWTEPQSMQMAYASIVSGEHPWVALGDFGNYFFADDPECSRRMLIRDDIHVPTDATPEQFRWAAFCAASVVYLCHKYELEIPTWVHLHPRLETAWFQDAETNLVRRERYLKTTPPEFIERNIFCGDRVWQDKKEEAMKLRRRLLSV